MLGTETLDALAHTKVAVFGLGGVGSWCAESLENCSSWTPTASASRT